MALLGLWLFLFLFVICRFELAEHLLEEGFCAFFVTLLVIGRFRLFFFILWLGPP